MYLKLGNTTLNYYESLINESVLVSEVVKSPMSYQFPILVKNSTELDIWFGSEDWPEKDYLNELIASGAYLYLYRPINIRQNSELDYYIPYTEYPIDPNLYFIDIPEHDLPKVGVSEFRYQVISSEGSELSADGVRFDYYIWLEGVYVNCTELPQNIDEMNSISLSNRDTLTLTPPDYSKTDRCHPKFIYGKVDPEYKEIVDYTTLETNIPNLDNIDLEIETLSLDILFQEDVDFTKKSSYIALDESNIIWFDADDGRVFLRELSALYPIKTFINTKDRDQATILNEFWDIVKSFGYTFINEVSIYKKTVYRSIPLKVSYLYDLEGFEYIPNKLITYNIISQLVYKDSADRISFVSKTIGASQDLINVRIEKPASTQYRFTISRGSSYSEVYENSEESLQALAEQININSKLVTCNINPLQNWSKELPLGDWDLRRAVVEDITSVEEVKLGMSYLQKFEGIFPDYHLIPDLSDYVDVGSKNYSLIADTYVDILSFAKNLRCQVLIQNSDFLKDEEGRDNEYVFNYIEDSENYLVYFYRSMEVNGITRPGYYAFLSSIVTDNYAVSTKLINYNSPTENAYEVEDIEILLEKKKSNFLVDNNLTYYYKKYFNGEDPSTSIWMRFCLGKVYRELQKRKWSFLGMKSGSVIRKEIEKILQGIVLRYSMIISIEITEFNLDLLLNTLDLTIETQMSDLIDNNITLDVTLNFNKL